MSVRVTIELAGVARVAADRKEVSILAPEGAAWRDVIAMLAQELPILVDRAITSDHGDLVPPYLLNVGGKRTIKSLDEEAEIGEGEHLILFEATC